ncbi:MAG TPA: DUF5596 domain-containing protein [Candidatus Eisenbergiella stercoravium]|nr:DUF5596 domain-containing protein [Candidatus Eisenbergiella stercoravium]
MTAETFMEKIGLSESAQKEIGRWNPGQAEREDWERLYRTDEESFWQKLRMEEQPRRLALVLFVTFAISAHEEYRKKGIADQIYFDTFRDIAIWNRECKRKYGEEGLAEVEWISRSVKLQLFRLGRLQFEPGTLEKELFRNGEALPVGTPVLYVHIPAEEPLSEEACRDSFRRAAEFWKNTKRIYVCESWLLSPHLKDILKEDSNILRFQEMFELAGVDEDSRQAEERVFGKFLADKNKYPEKTSLQRAMKAYLLNHNRVGSGTGVRLED